MVFNFSSKINGLSCYRVEEKNEKLTGYAIYRVTEKKNTGHASYRVKEKNEKINGLQVTLNIGFLKNAKIN